MTTADDPLGDRHRVVDCRIVVLPSGTQVSGDGERCLVFVPGFLVPPSAYRSIVERVAAAAVQVVVPLLTRPGPAALLGRVRPEHEGELLAAIVTDLRTSHSGVWIGGHSRGGLVAWIATGLVGVDGLVLVDPVAGGGPPWADPEPLPQRTAPPPTLVVGLGDASRCAPDARGHRVFAAAAPGCDHVVVPGAGHADVLDGWSSRIGGVVCPRGVDPDGTRRTVAELIVAAVSATPR